MVFRKMKHFNLMTVNLYQPRQQITITPMMHSSFVVASQYLQNCKSALPSKNAVSAYQMKYKLLPFTLEEICRNEQTINSLS